MMSFFFFFFHLFMLLLFNLYFNTGFILSFSFLSFDSFTMDFLYLFDSISFGFSSFVLLISSVVFIYSDFYMGKGFPIGRFVLLLFCFVLSMMMLVFGFNMFSLMIGWDGLGVVSFLLVVYYNSHYSLTSGMLTVLSNRIGDLFMIFSFFFFFFFGWWGTLTFSLGDSVFLSFLVILSAMTKSAQFPFSAWLPAAMAAPTPISSLVHSSTLVTAGVYLLIRFYYSLSHYYSSFFFCVISLMTMFFGGFLAVFDCDLKKVIAMSTLSQLGFMMYSISVGEWLFGFFHMLCHALYKSLLFLSGGVFINFSSGDQDVRFKGGLSFSSPLFFVIFVFSSLSLMGFPFLSGYFSKDYVLELSFLDGWGFLYLLMFFFSCLFTYVYSLRIFFFGLFSYSGYYSSFSFFSFNLNSIFMFLLFSWSLYLGYYVGGVLLFDVFLVVYSFFKVFVLLLYALGFFMFYLFIYLNFLGWFGPLAFDYFYLFWFSSSYFSSGMILYSNFSSFEVTWMEKLGPMVFYDSKIAYFYSWVSGSYFYKIIFFFSGMVILNFFFF